MLLRQLEYLIALARERHFARAARMCHVSQPSLSGAIKRLEAELDVPIVRRGHRFEGFTPEGERVLQWAQRIVAERDALLAELATLRTGLAGHLRLAAIPTAVPAVTLLSAPFCAAHPLMRVSVESRPAAQLLQRLSEFALDAVLTYVDGALPPGLRAIPLYTEHYLLLTPAHGVFARRRTVTWAEAAGSPLCLLSPVMQNRQILDEAFAGAGVVAEPTIETDTVAALYAHVATHRWSSVISHAWLHLFGVPDGMRVVPLVDPERRATVGLVTGDHVPEPIATRALRTMARDLAIDRTLAELLRRHEVR